jgi:Protein of unknown function (DUF3828)
VPGRLANSKNTFRHHHRPCAEPLNLYDEEQATRQVVKRFSKGMVADMKTLASVLILVALFLCTGFSSAAQKRSGITRRTSPDALVADLYRQSERNHSPFFQTKNRALLDKYFVKGLAELIWKDALNSRGEVGAIDGDPLFNAQDTEITKFSIHRPVYVDGKAEVTVSFENFRQKQEVRFSLVSTSAGWKIENIKYNDGSSLRGILKGDQAHFFEGRCQVPDTSSGA